MNPTQCQTPIVTSEGMALVWTHMDLKTSGSGLSSVGDFLADIRGHQFGFLTARFP